MFLLFLLNISPAEWNIIALFFPLLLPLLLKNKKVFRFLNIIDVEAKLREVLVVHAIVFFPFFSRGYCFTEFPTSPLVLWISHLNMFSLFSLNLMGVSDCYADLFQIRFNPIVKEWLDKSHDGVYAARMWVPWMELTKNLTNFQKTMFKSSW